MELYFEYGERETEYLKSKDKQLGSVIEKIGHIKRAADKDLFSSVIHHIIGQQISSKAQETVWKRLRLKYGDVTPDTLKAAEIKDLCAQGMTGRKAGYIKDFAEKVANGQFDLASVYHMTDEDAVAALSGLKGIGVWTAEMILLFCLQRPNVFSYGDLALSRGIRMIYHYKKVDKELFEKYRLLFSPYCSVASLYLWAVSGGAIPDMKDYSVFTH